MERRSALPHVHYRRQGASVPNPAERDAYLAVEALTELARLAGREQDRTTEVRAVLAARSVTRALLAGAPNEPARAHLFGVVDVLDFWIDGCTTGQRRAQWRRIVEQHGLVMGLVS